MESAHAEIVTDPAKFENNAITPEERQQMIAEAAYFRAQHRGFTGGSPEHDWLEAEREIDNVFHMIY